MDESMLIDTHCHLHFKEFDADREEVIGRARAAGIGYFVNIGTDPATNVQALALAEKHDFIYSTIGLHPHHSHEVSDADLTDIGRSFSTKTVAIGEIGLDYFKSEAAPDTQKKAFIHMIRFALLKKKPVVVHSRNAFRDTLDVLKTEGQGSLRGVMHCFSYGKEELRELLDIGFLASFTGNITFKSAAALLEVAAFAPLESIMLETDAPYLAPQSLRGQRNEPAFLTHTAKVLAEKRGIPEEKLAVVTSQNAKDLFLL